jgi:arylsulfatase A-like enzyme
LRRWHIPVFSNFLFASDWIHRSKPIENMPNKPNIIYIHSHDTGRYIEPYGHAVPTPNLQKFAEQGVLFRQNFCINPTCSPSRAALLTGSFPHENGMLGLAHRGFSLHDYGQHLLHTLRKAGYLSIQTGTQHIAMPKDDLQPWQISGYDRHVGEGHCGRAGAIEILENLPEEPFFMAVGFGDTHRPFPPLEESPYDPKYTLPPAPLPDNQETREDMARFKASALILDRKIGDILDALDRSGQADNTLVICTTDHGIPHPRMKCNLEDSGIGVMLLMRGPGGFSGGKVVDSMVSHLDIFPTACDLAGVEQPEWLRGKSLLPLVNREVEHLHDTLFFEVNFHAAYEPLRAARTDRYKYIRRFETREKSVLVNCDKGESKDSWMDHDWQNRRTSQESLFDLCFDPNEMNNLINQPEHQDVLADMRKRLDAWMQETNDPLLKGALQAPEGANINSSDDLGVGKRSPWERDRNS